MKSQSILRIKFLSLSILVSCITFGLYAQEKHSDLLSQNIEINKFKPVPKTKIESQKNLPALEIGEVVEEKQQLEEWMFNREFFQIKRRFEWDKQPVEKPREIEEWMKNIKIKKNGCIDIYSDFVEKDWMREHTFFIL